MEYKTEYLELRFLSIGGYWGFASIKIRDTNGTVKIRLAKCKKKSTNFPKTQKYLWQKIDVSEISNLSQVQRINFKNLDVFELVADQLKKNLQLIE